MTEKKDRWKIWWDGLSILSALAFYITMLGAIIENKSSLLYPASLSIICLISSRIALAIHYELKKEAFK